MKFERRRKIPTPPTPPIKAMDAKGLLAAALRAADEEQREADATAASRNAKLIQMAEAVTLRVLGVQGFDWEVTLNRRMKTTIEGVPVTYYNAELYVEVPRQMGDPIGQPMRVKSLADFGRAAKVLDIKLDNEAEFDE